MPSILWCKLVGFFCCCSFPQDDPGLLSCILLFLSLGVCTVPVSLTLVREWFFKNYVLLSHTCATKCSRVTCMPAGRYRRCCRSLFLRPLNWCTCYVQLTPFDSPARPWAYKRRGWPGRQKETSTQVAGCLGGERRADADCHRWCQWGQRVWMGCLHGNLWWETTLIKDCPVDRPLSVLEDHW